MCAEPMGETRDGPLTGDSRQTLTLPFGFLVLATLLFLMGCIQCTVENICVWTKNTTAPNQLQIGVAGTSHTAKITLPVLSKMIHQFFPCWTYCRSLAYKSPFKDIQTVTHERSSSNRNREIKKKKIGMLQLLIIYHTL